MPKTQDLKDTIHQRMLALMRHAFESGKALNAEDWCEQIGINYRNFNQKGTARQGYTDDQKLAACRITGANMNWIFGLEKNMMRTPGKDPVQQMREALISIELEIGRKSGRTK